jgi:hypothetical protein
VNVHALEFVRTSAFHFPYFVLEEKGFTRSLCASHRACAWLCEGKKDISVFVDGARSSLQMAVWIEMDVGQVVETNWRGVLGYSERWMIEPSVRVSCLRHKQGSVLQGVTFRLPT